jgi:hypothetical protein
MRAIHDQIAQIKYFAYNQTMKGGSLNDDCQCI